MNCWYLSSSPSIFFLPPIPLLYFSLSFSFFLFFSLSYSLSSFLPTFFFFSMFKVRLTFFLVLDVFSVWKSLHVWLFVCLYCSFFLLSITYIVHPIWLHCKDHKLFWQVIHFYLISSSLTITFSMSSPNPELPINSMDQTWIFLLFFISHFKLNLAN